MKSLLRPTFAFAYVFLCLLFTARPAAAGLITSMDDIQLWAGTGPNRAVLIIDWTDGKTVPGQSAGQALAWGFRWENGANPTAEDMMLAIDAIDVRLQVSYIDYGGDLGRMASGIGYDLDNDGSYFTFTLAPASGTTSDTQPADDHVGYGDDTHYWAYYVDAAPSSTVPTGAQWGYADTGMSGRHLVDGSWDSWVNTDFTDPNAPTEPVAALAATPEPSTACLLLLGVAGLASQRRRRR